MSDVFVPILCALLPLLLGGLAAYGSRGRCRASALAELEILSRLDTDSAEARYLREVFSRRLRTWWQKETAGTGTHVVVTLTCVSVLYLLAVAGWFGRHLLRSHELDLVAATRVGDLAAAEQAGLIISELVAAGEVLTTLAFIAAGLGLVHALFWLARHLLAKKRWAETPFREPGSGLLRGDRTECGLDGGVAPALRPTVLMKSDASRARHQSPTPGSNRPGLG